MKFFSAVAKLFILITICALYLINKKTSNLIDETSFKFFGDENAYLILTKSVDVYGKHYRENKDELEGLEIATLSENDQILIKKTNYKHGYSSYIIFYFENGTPKLGYLLENGNIGRKEYDVRKSTTWYSDRKDIYDYNDNLFTEITNEFLEEAKDIIFVSSDFSKQKRIKKQKNKILETLIKPNKYTKTECFYYVPSKSYSKYKKIQRKYQKKYNDLYKYELPQYTLLERIKGIK